LGTEAVFLLNGISYLVAAYLESCMNYKADNRECRSDATFLTELREVFEFVGKNRNLLRMTLVFTVVNFFWDPVLAIALPYTLKNQFSVSPIQFGLIETALPAGFCLGALYFSKKRSLLEDRHILYYSIIGANVLFTVFSLPIIFGEEHQATIGLVVFFFLVLTVIGVCSAALNISVSLAIQSCVPGLLLGKYLGFSRSLSTGLVPVGAGIVGASLGRVSTEQLFIAAFMAVYIILIILPKDSYATPQRSRGFSYSEISERILSKTGE